VVSILNRITPFTVTPLYYIDWLSQKLIHHLLQDATESTH